MPELAVIGILAVFVAAVWALAAYENWRAKRLRHRYGLRYCRRCGDVEGHRSWCPTTREE